jgi:crossover junction endodeoxyribonuclease RusA
MIEFVVPGRPVPKERPRTSLAGRKMHIYTPRATSQYEKLVGYAALSAANGKSFFKNIAVEIKLFFRDRRFGDLDNYTKSILDGLQGVIFENDKQVCRLTVERHQDKEERAEVKVWAVEEAEKGAS